MLIFSKYSLPWFLCAGIIECGSFTLRAGYKLAFGDDWPLSKSVISRLEINYESLVDLIDTSDLCNKLFSEEVINNRQKQFILSKPTDAEKNAALLDIFTKCSLRQYKMAIDCFNCSNQGHVANILSEGGGQ